MPRIEIDEVRCKGCGLCTIACPHKLLVLGDKLNLLGYLAIVMETPGKCTGCAMCAKICPDLAIAVFK